MKVKEIRERLQLNQKDFWARIGVTQSGGSRYENGRRINQPVTLLIGLAYGKNPSQQLKQLRKWHKTGKR